MTPTDTITTDLAPVPAADLARIEGGVRTDIGCIPSTVLGPGSLPLPPKPFTDLFVKYQIG